MQRNAFPINDTIVHEEDVPDYQVNYRFHLTDPMRFEERIRVTMEHGHVNHLADDWSSTAYWYQTLPGPRLDIPSVDDRLPRRPQSPPLDGVGAADRQGLDELRTAMREQRNTRMTEFEAKRAEWLRARANATRERQLANAEQARQIRAAFLERHR